jgi:hypothetical protein
MIEKHLNNYVKRILQFQCPFTLKNGGYNRFFGRYSSRYMVQVLCTLYLYSIDSFGMPCFFKRGAVKQFNIIHV